MSDEDNIATVRRFAEALEAGDLERAAEELAPKVEIDDRDIPDADGRDSFREWIGRWNGSFESWRIEEITWLAAGDDKVLALFRMIATGRGSGIELERDDAVLAELRDGRIARIGYYNDQAQALEAAGLPANG